MRYLTASLLCGALLAPSAFSQQQKPPEELPAPIQVDVNLVNLLVSVHDKHGGLVNTLNQGDFEVSEDGKPQTIKYFTRETDLPLTIGLLVDVSKSQENLIDVEKNAAYQFFSQVLRKKDLAFLISFGEDAELLQDFTGSPRLLQHGLDQLRVNSGVSGTQPGPVPTISQPRGTVLYDAVYLAASDRLVGQVGRKVIVLITDGMDEGSRLKLDEAVEAAQKSDAVIYSIYYVDHGAYYGSFTFPSDSALKRMSEETGGRVFRVDRKHTLESVFKELQDEMRSQYSIAYSPINDKKDGTFRKVDVKLRDKSYRVQVRKGYYAIKPERR